MDFYEPYIQNDRQRNLVDLAGVLADAFSERGEAYDREDEFPYDNFKDLKKKGYGTLSLPKEYGGEEISLYELVMIQERLATGAGILGD
jgi:alkylation response protein AidB-like acyl-CoA dehydrogenase